MNKSRPKVLTWHIHGSYLYYLSQANCEFFLPKGEGEGYGGRTDSFPWGSNVREVPVEEVGSLLLDCIIFQSTQNYQTDQHKILSSAQRALPKIYLEHDPPRENPFDQQHVVDDPATLLVHVTHFNNLMWNSGRTPTKVIEHGVPEVRPVPPAGTKPRGLVVVNNLKKRGRRLGLDVFEQAQRELPLDLIGIGSEELGGLGEVPPAQLRSFMAGYSFFFNPIRFTSLGLAVCEAMMCGLPIVALATTEMPTVVQNGWNGFADTNPEALIARMKLLLANPELAARLGANAAIYARERFGLSRFAAEWEQTIQEVVASPGDASA